MATEETLWAWKLMGSQGSSFNSGKAESYISVACGSKAFLAKTWKKSLLDLQPGKNIKGKVFHDNNLSSSAWQ